MGKITTGKVRLSYTNLFKPRAFAEGGEEKYSVVLLIPKTDKAQVQKIMQNKKAQRSLNLPPGLVGSLWWLTQ